MMLEVIDQFIYVDCTITSKLLFDIEIDKHTAIAVTAIAKLSKNVWGNSQLALRNKLFQADVLRILFHGSGTWSTYICQKNHLDSFHFRCLQRMHGIVWNVNNPWIRYLLFC